MRDEVRDELDELLLRHQEDDLAETGHLRLNELLRGSPDARRHFVQSQLMDAAFHLEQANVLEPDISPPAPKKTTLHPFLWLTIAASVILLLGIGIGSIFNKTTERPDPIADLEPTDDGVALLTEALDVVWDGEHQPSAGSPLAPGNLQFSSGLIHLEFYSGAELIIEGPADLDLISTNEAVCRSGKLRARVPEVARGFTVRSPQFELVDLGTEFGVEIGTGGKVEVQVFDGEVEIYPPDGKRSPDQLKRLLAGSGISWAASGTTAGVIPAPENYPSFEDVETRSNTASQNRLKRWRHWSRSIANDPRVIAHYDFEGTGKRLKDRSESRSHGTIIGCDHTSGRWAGKGALEFKRPGDRVRVDIPGEFESLTVAAWIRMDALPSRRQALLLTDSYRMGHLHWQAGPQGELRFGSRINLERKDGKLGTGYSSPPVFGSRTIGTWNFVCSTFDQKEGHARHFFNGREVSRHAIISDQAIKIGAGDIGNWSMPLANKRVPNPVRNFVGRIDEVIIWKAALSTNEIMKIYRANRP